MILIVSLLDSGVITATKIFNYETDPTSFLLIVDTGGVVRHVLTINIIDIPEPPDCTADPLFPSGSGMTLIFSYYLVSMEVYSEKDETSLLFNMEIFDNIIRQRM